MRRFTSCGLPAIEMPPIQADPLCAVRIPLKMRMVVLLPAPLGPRNPTISPFATVKLIFLIAHAEPNRRERFFTRMLMS